MGNSKEIRVITPVVNGPDTVSETFWKEVAGTSLSPDYLKVSQAIISTGTPSIESEYDEILCAPNTLSLAIEAERDGVQAVVIDCMSDPALAAAREALTIPVIGPNQAAMHTASLLGQNFGMIVLSRDVMPIHQKLAAVYGMSQKLLDLAPVDVHPTEIANLCKTAPDEFYTQLGDAAIRLLEKGAQSIILGCTGFLGCVARIRSHIGRAGYSGVPIIDPIPNAILVASALSDLSLSQSKVSFPKPHPQQVSGYDPSWKLL